VLVVLVANLGSGVAGAVADRLNLSDGVAGAKCSRFDVVSALGHGVIVTQEVVSEVTASDNTGALEPAPWGSNLATIASETEAGRSVAAAGSVSDGKKGCATSGDTGSVVESLGGSVSPAGAAVRLVTDVVDHGLASGPGSASVEASGEVNVGSCVSLVGRDSPLGVNDSSHQALDFLQGSTSEFVVGFGGPGGVHVVNILNMGGQVNGCLSQ